MRWKKFQWTKFLFRHSSNSRKLSRQKFYNELACVFTAHYASKNADWNQQQLTDGGILANWNSANHPYCFLSNQKKSPDSGFFTCDPTKKCIMPSSRERLKGIKGRGHDLRLRFVQHVKLPKSTFSTQLILVPRATQPRDQETTGSGDENGRDVLTLADTNSKW